jgi:hypothetical protein
MTKHRVTLRRKRSPHIMERHPRFEILVNGEAKGEAYFNMTGYRAGIPMHDGSTFDPGEVSEARLRSAVADVNRWAREAKP